MNCEQVRELLSAYLDSMLTSEERASVIAHMQTCAACSAIIEDYRRFDTLLSHLPSIRPDILLQDKIFSSSEYLQLASIFGSVEQSNEYSNRQQIQPERNHP